MADTRRTRRQRLALLLVCGLRTASGFAGLRPRTQTRLRPLSAPLRMRAEHGGIDGVRPRPVDALAAFDKALGLDGAQVSSELSPAGGSSLALANQWTREDVKSAWAAATESATQTVGISKPPRVKALFSDAGTLVLKVAPIRNESKLKLAAPGLFFSVAWLSIVADLTIKLLKSRSFFSVAFLLPFWYAGVTTGSYALEEGRRATSMQIIQIGEFEWLITEVEPQKRSRLFGSVLPGKPEGVVMGRGPTESLTGVHVATRVRTDTHVPEEGNEGFIVSTVNGIEPSVRSILNSQESRWLAFALDSFISNKVAEEDDRIDVGF
mmetsp:Transcript_10357/g.31026  ORF Transcript_10357/g.31026 Transcript_10357/m.31026 type:complete len:323 (-) Transcript_10357:692-1660(-)